MRSFDSRVVLCDYDLMKPYERPVLAALCKALEKPLPVFQVLAGPRQVGKTTLAKQAISRLGMPSVYASADSPLPPGPEWIESQWRLAQLKSKNLVPALLVLDEIQKVRGWPETIKRLWDGQEPEKPQIRLLLLGSSVLLLREGLAESLAGRFFLHRCSHWTFSECRAAFGWSFNQWLYFGGYPGGSAFTADEAEWRQYVSEALVETVLAKDVLQLQRIAKPTLLRHLFALASGFPAQVLSYNKMLGQLQDAGNTTTLAHYLNLLESAMLASGLEAFWRGRMRKRGSSPKLILWNNALVTAISARTLDQSVQDSAWRGRLVENAVGAHLLNGLSPSNFAVSYWHEGDKEVDFVVTAGATDWALEVKSGREGKVAGVQAFRSRYPESRALLIGGGGIDLEDFFLRPATEWFNP
jgi:predicted AAA+ superfamily ATPase